MKTEIELEVGDIPEILELLPDDGADIISIMLEVEFIVNNESEDMQKVEISNVTCIGYFADDEITVSGGLYYNIKLPIKELDELVSTLFKSEIEQECLYYFCNSIKAWES